MTSEAMLFCATLTKMKFALDRYTMCMLSYSQAKDGGGQLRSTYQGVSAMSAAEIIALLILIIDAISLGLKLGQKK